MSEELHHRLREFLIGEVNRKHERQCVRITLAYAPAKQRPTPLKDWQREEDPEIFDTLALTEKLCSTITEFAEHYADTFNNKSRFVVTTYQHLGGKAELAFVMTPGAVAGDEDTALASSGASSVTALSEGSSTHVISTLLRTNQMMFEGTIRSITSMNIDLKDENAELRGEVRTLRNELDEARSTRMEREFNVQLLGAKHQQRSEALKQFMNFATIALAKFTAGKGGDVKASGASSALRVLVSQYSKSLRPEQYQALFGLHDEAQQALLMEIMQLAAREEAEAAAAQGVAEDREASNGATAAERSPSGR